MVVSAASPTGPVPELRGELSISFRADKGIAKALIYDPLSHRYFELSHQSTALIQNWSLRDPATILQSTKAIGAAASEAAIESLSKFLVENGLAKHPGSGQGFALWHMQQAQKKTMTARFASLIFLRVPLGNPDPMLSALYAVAWPLLTRTFAALTIGAFFCAFWLLSHMPETLVSNFKDLLSLQSSPLLILAIGLVKLGHELGHGLQAKRLGLRVPSSGIMFLLGLPLPFVELSSAWQLERKADRLRVDAGGILAETAIAGWSLLAFCFWPDGAMRMVLLAMASTSLMLSLIVNLNPLMRFDGYFLLSDTLGIKNLQQRSLTLMKWRLREILFNLSDPMPEPWPKPASRWLILYGTLLNLYRITLYIGIAIMAYSVLNKLFGVAVFVFEILFFIGLPILREMRVWWSRRRDIATRRRTYVSAMTFGALIALMVIPMPQHIIVPARLSNVKTTDFFVPANSVLQQVLIEDGQSVISQQDLWRFQNQTLEFDHQSISAQIQSINKRIERLAAETTDRSQAPLLESERSRLMAEQVALQESGTKLTLNAPSMGIARATSLMISGQTHDPIALPSLTVLGAVLERQPITITLYIPSGVLPELPDQTTGYFRQGIDAHVFGFPRKAELATIQIDASPVQRITAPEMTSRFGGMIATDPNDPERPQSTWFLGTAGLASAPEIDQALSLSGHVALRATNKSYAERVATQIARTLVQHIGN